MALQIDVQRVTAVLLSDGWHFITPKTFQISHFEFDVPDDSGQTKPSMLLGFTFTKTDQISRETQLYSGPLSSLLAVRHEPVMELVVDEEGQPGDR